MMPDLPPAIFLMGPTASGKTALALALYEKLPVEIVSVDSSQVYRGMDIGTAKPTAVEQARAAHRLIDIRDPAQAYSASEFCADALREMEDITRQRHIPLLVGGTMFYFHALEYGLSELPSADPEIRARLAKEAGHTGWPVMHRRLQAVDPVTAGQIKPNDAQRIQRALELFELTGQPPSQLKHAAPPQAPPYHFIKIALVPKERERLHACIARRFHAMLEQGLVDEVKRLYSRGDLNLNMPSMRAVGYRQIWEYLTNKIGYNEMVNKAIAATRQLAKRQMTWLRGYPDVQFLYMEEKLPLKTCLDHLQGIARPRS
ncbi:MAG: tRNA (adenosine(37)-N6)-dimethylallyltransferase MiaA [Gammaproteobacteria bacterium]|nr:MAG: tRNA (adenosine(37)-N6)-dimethylallyltransferase MiaA [Gammaproteobacteria bacterium]